jgi:hypothetical protein
LEEIFNFTYYGLGIGCNPASLVKIFILIDEIMKESCSTFLIAVLVNVISTNTLNGVDLIF